MPELKWLAVPPEEAALRVLDALFSDMGTLAGQPTGTIDLSGFQEDAVRRARRCLAERGGVVIADSVGLGKTWIGLALIEDVMAAGGRVTVIHPASLRRHWSDPLRRLTRRHEVELLAGGPPPVGGNAAASGRASVVRLSHTRLSRDFAPDAFRPLDLVVVDEAHAFRNPLTRRYRSLARLCRATPTVLLTATPVNNSLLDLYFLLRLFSGDGAFRDLGIDDLAAAFRTACADNQPSPALRAVLGAVVIRRTRALIDPATLPGGLRFPARAAPVAVRYDLRAAYPDLLPALRDFLESATFAPFRADVRSSVSGRNAGGGADDLLRVLLLKRLESSTAALRASLESLRRYHVAFLESLRAGRLLLPKDRERDDASDGAQLVMDALVLSPVPKGVDAHAIARAAAEDLRRIEHLLARLASAAEDPKRAALGDLLAGPLRGRKVLIFTEFRDTARHLWTALRRAHATALITGDGAFLGESRSSRRAIIDRFAPLANGAGIPHPRERADVLIATDVLSEGLNLQDAAHVVSYDLPWNPVRLIQRIGRIDRLGSPHARVYSYNLLPDHDLEELLGLMGRLEMKLAAIRAGVGAEDRVLPRATVMARLAAGDQTLLDDIERAEAAPWERPERLRAEWLARRHSPTVVGPSSGATLATVVEDPDASAACAIVVIERRGQTMDGRGARAPLRFIRIDPSDDAPPADCSGEDLMLRALHAPRGPVPEPRLVERAVANALAAPDITTTRARIPPRSTAARAARAVLGDLARTRDPDPDYCARAARIVDQLARTLTTGQELALHEELTKSPPPEPETHLAALEAAIRLRAENAPTPTPTPTPRPLAVFEIRPHPSPAPAKPPPFPDPHAEPEPHDPTPAVISLT